MITAAAERDKAIRNLTSRMMHIGKRVRALKDINDDQLTIDELMR